MRSTSVAGGLEESHSKDSEDTKSKAQDTGATGLSHDTAEAVAAPVVQVPGSLGQ